MYFPVNERELLEQIAINPNNFEKLRIIRYHTGKLTETHPTRSKIIQKTEEETGFFWKKR